MDHRQCAALGASCAGSHARVDRITADLTGTSAAPIHVVAASGGKFLTGRTAPADLPQQRRERIGAALSKKGPKLRAEHRVGARTVLILEDDDSALSNPIDIGAALHAELAQLDCEIDDVYLVETKLPYCWQIWRMKQGTKQWPTPYESPALGGSYRTSSRFDNSRASRPREIAVR